MNMFEETLIVDLKSQNLKIKNEVDQQVIASIEFSNFLVGPQADEFKISLYNVLFF